MLYMEGGLLTVQAKASDQPPNAGGFESPSQQKNFLGFQFLPNFKELPRPFAKLCNIQTLHTP